MSLQSPAQLDSIYGRETAKIIIANCATKIVFIKQSPEILFLKPNQASVRLAGNYPIVKLQLKIAKT